MACSTATITSSDEVAVTPEAEEDTAYYDTTDSGNLGSSLEDSRFLPNVGTSSELDQLRSQFVNNGIPSYARAGLINGMEPPRKRPRLGQGCKSTTNVGRIDDGYLGAHLELPRASLADNQISNNLSTTNNGYTPSPHDFPLVGGPLPQNPEQNAATALQSTDWGYQNSLPLLPPSPRNDREDIGFIQCWTSDQLQSMGFTPGAQDDLSDLEYMQSWIPEQLHSLGC